MSCQVSTAIRTPQALRWLTGQAVGAEEDAALFVGVDWGGRHHDVCVLDQDGGVLAARRIPDGLAGAGELHALVAGHAEGPGLVAVGIETDRGLLVGTLLAAGYQVYAVKFAGGGPLPRPPPGRAG